MKDNNTDEQPKVVEQKLKVIIVGDPGAGKKDVARGADVCVPFKSLGLSIGVKENLDKKINFKLTLVFWTLTTGRPSQTTYYHGADAAIIVGGLNSKQSLKTMRSWAESINANIGEIPLFFIGTKMNTKSTKNIDVLAELAKDYNSRYFILPNTQDTMLKPILKSIAKHLAKSHSKFSKGSSTNTTK